MSKPELRIRIWLDPADRADLLALASERGLSVIECARRIICSELRHQSTAMRLLGWTASQAKPYKHRKRVYGKPVNEQGNITIAGSMSDSTTSVKPSSDCESQHQPIQPATQHKADGTQHKADGVVKEFTGV